MLLFLFLLAVLAVAVLGFLRLRFEFVEAGENVSGWQRRQSRQEYLRRTGGYKVRICCVAP